jgi:hypothetical protein
MVEEEVKLTGIGVFSSSGFLAIFITLFLFLLFLVSFILLGADTFGKSGSIEDKLWFALVFIFAVPVAAGIISFILSVITLWLINFLLRAYGGVTLKLDIPARTGFF